MHSFQGKSCTIHINGDLKDSDLIIIDKNGVKVRIDSNDVLELVAEYVRKNIINKVCHMGIDELLKKI